MTHRGEFKKQKNEDGEDGWKKRQSLSTDGLEEGPTKIESKSEGISIVNQKEEISKKIDNMELEDLHIFFNSVSKQEDSEEHSKQSSFSI